MYDPWNLGMKKKEGTATKVLCAGNRLNRGMFRPVFILTTASWCWFNQQISSDRFSDKLSSIVMSNISHIYRLQVLQKPKLKPPKDL